MIHKCNWFQARLPQVRNYRGIADVEALIKSTEAPIKSTGQAWSWFPMIILLQHSNAQNRRTKKTKWN